ncbi:hypothetical protein PBY51_014579 [Eleginops maclovinus]|uniref:C-type lectin domain-containing protein n=1 Tax=Eleginops maclovinus TaxID=56733 RepID=A0AAN7WXD7_ELEMC|nr:hypothetical protein PBY51_014579 [Eleginops maclovinus]
MFPLVTVAVFGVIMGMTVTPGNTARVVSGQTVCLGGPDQPCYKIAYFHDVTSRVAFREARQACEMDRGELISIQSPEEQRDIENLLQDLRSGAQHLHFLSTPIQLGTDGKPRILQELVF